MRLITGDKNVEVVYNCPLSNGIFNVNVRTLILVLMPLRRLNDAKFSSGDCPCASNTQRLAFSLCLPSQSQKAACKLLSHMADRPKERIHCVQRLIIF